jgi:TolA-binding protein
MPSWRLSTALGKPDASLSACREFLKKYGSSSRRPTAEYFLACSQEALGKHGDAEETLRNLIKQHKDSPHQADAVLLLGQCMENQGKFDEAVDQYRKFSDTAPRERQGEGYYSLGLALYKAAKYPESIKALSTVLSKHGDSQYAPAARLQLGLAQLAGGKADDARETLTKVLKSDKQREPKARYWLAQCDITQGKFQSAREALDAMAKSSPPPENLDAVLYDRAICAMEMGKFDMAAGEFAAFLKQYSKSEQAADALYRQAFCLHKLARYAESQALCEQIAGQKPANVAAATAELSAENLFLLTKYAEAAGSFGDLMKASGGDKDRTLRFTFRLGQCAFLAGDYPKAIGLLKQVAGQPEAAGNEQLREAAFFLGDAQFQTGQYADAAGAFGGYLANKGQRQQEAQFKLGLSQVRARQLDRAEKTLEAMLSESADSPWVMRAMFAYGQLAYHELHKPDKAAGVLQKILDGKAPEDLVGPTMYLMAWIDFDAKKYQQAAGRFGDLVKRFEKHELAGDASLQRAICLKEMGKTEEAIELLAQFPKTYPNAERLPEARHLLGTCLALPKIGKQDEAIKVFSALADEKGARTEAVLYELAWAQRAAKATKDATETYQRLLREFPSGKLSAPARTELAELLYLDQKYAEAASLVEKVVADNAVEAKTRAVAQYRLGWCQAKLSEATKAAETFADFVAKYPDHELAPSAMYEAGVAYMQSEKLADAQKRFAALIDKHPKHDVVPFAYLKLGEAQAGTGEYDKSAATYQTFLEKHPETKFAYLAQFGIGWASENLKQYDEARKWYSRPITAKPRPGRSSRWASATSRKNISTAPRPSC